MEKLQELITFMLVLIPLAGAVRGVQCCMMMAAAEDTSQYKRRLINLGIYIILAETVVGIISLLLSYYA